MVKLILFFLYGTLQIRKQHENILRELGGNWQKGYNTVSWLISAGPDYFTLLKLDKKGAKICGMVFDSKFREKIEEIDKFEGKNYKRVVTEIYLENGSKIQAYLYELKKKNWKD